MQLVMNLVPINCFSLPPHTAPPKDVGIGYILQAPGGDVGPLWVQIKITPVLSFMSVPQGCRPGRSKSEGGDGRGGGNN